MSVEGRVEIGGRKFPEMVIGIGGAGKRLVKELLRSEWFVKSVIEDFDRSQGAGQYRGTTIRIIDSDRGDIPRDRRELDEIRKFINATSGDKNYAEEVFGLDSSCYLNISVSPTYLLDPEFEKRVKGNKRLGVKVWWIDDEEYGIKNFASMMDRDFESATFANGVNRRRFLSKALMYHYLVETPENRNPLVVAGRGRYIAIVISLGGGTGCGTVFDITRFLKRTMPNCSIILFAVLPTYLEPENERMNTYAALSELEKFGDIFDLIILSPIDHSEYRGGDVRDSSYGALKEFSEVFPYIFTATYDRIFADDPDIGETHRSITSSYRKFVAASGYIVRYAAESSVEKGTKIRKNVESLINYCKKEKELRGKMDNLLMDINIKIESIKAESQEDFEDRLKEFRKVFYDGEYAEILKSADYKVIEKFKENVERIQREEVEKLKAGVRDTKLDPSLSGDEKELLDAAETWLSNIEMFKDQISVADSEIFDMTLRDAFKRMVKYIPFSGELSVDLEKKEKDLSSEISRISNEIEESREETSVLEKIHEIKEFLERCNSKKNELIKQGERMDEEDWKKKVETGNFRRKLEDWKVAEDLLRELEKASEYCRLQASEEYYNKRAKQWWRIFIEWRRNQKMAKIAKETKEEIKFRMLEEDLQTRELKVLDRIFDYIPKPKDVSVSIEAVKKLEGLRKQVRKKEHEKEIAEKRKKVIRGLWDLNGLSNEVTELRNEYETGFKEIQEMEVVGGGKFVHNISPEDLSVIRKVTESSDIRILSDSKSTDLNKIKEKVSNIFNAYVTPRLVKDFGFVSLKGILTAELDGKQREVGIDAIKIVTFSLSSGLNPVINEESWRDSYGRVFIPPDHQISKAGKWDAAVVTLSMFIPIEMLRNADYYFEAYESINKREGKKGLLPHYSAELEKGIFHIRKKLLSDSAVIRMKDLSDDEVRGEVDKIYEEVDLKEVIK